MESTSTDGPPPTTVLPGAPEGLLDGEWPLVLGTLLGLVLLVVRGDAFTPLDFPVGYDWSEYLTRAATYGSTQPAAEGDWRHQLYPLLLHLAGERYGYFQAGVLLSSLSAAICVVAAGLGARALAGPWAGGLAAASAPFINELALGARWLNPYPLLGAATGVALAGGVAAIRWPRIRWMVVAGLAGGAAWAVDTRGLLVLLTTGVLAATAVAVHPLPNAHRRNLILGFALAASLGVGFHLKTGWGRVESLAAQVEMQRGAAAASPGDAEAARLREVCRGYPRTRPLPLDPCARATLQLSARRNAGFYPFGWALTCLASGLVLLPATAGRRVQLASLLAFGAVAAMVGGMYALILVPGRYLMLVVVPVAWVVPVAMDRVAHSFLPPLAGSHHLALGLAAMAWVGLDGAGTRALLVPVDRDPEALMVGSLIREISQRAQPGEAVLDCSGGLVAAGLGPSHKVRVVKQNKIMSGIAPCEGWLRNGSPLEVPTWVVVPAGLKTTLLPGRAWTHVVTTTNSGCEASTCDSLSAWHSR